MRRRRQSLLALAIERKDWDAAAVVLLYGVMQAMKRMPPEAIEEMIELLSEEPPRRAKRVRRGHR
jgi:hypothetical protein